MAKASLLVRPISRLIPRDQTLTPYSSPNSENSENSIHWLGGRVLLKTRLKDGTPLSNSWFSNPGSTLSAWWASNPLKQTNQLGQINLHVWLVPGCHFTILDRPSPSFTAHCRPLESSRMSRSGRGWQLLAFAGGPRFPRANWPCKCWEKMPGRNGPVLTNRYKVVPHGWSYLICLGSLGFMVMIRWVDNVDRTT